MTTAGLVSLSEEFLRLAELRARDVLTDAEFAAAKTGLLETVGHPGNPGSPLAPQNSQPSLSRPASASPPPVQYPTPPALPHPMAPRGSSGEVTFYSANGVRITNTRAILDNTTYAMANITSVKGLVSDPDRRASVILGLVGLLLFVVSPAAAYLLLFIAAVIAIRQHSLYHVSIASASGEATALTSKNKVHVQQVVRAINEAMIYRGW